MKKIIFFLSILCLTSASHAQTNEEKALALIAAFESGDQTALDYVSGDTYINHNLTVPSGKDILFNFITGSPSGITTETVRSFETGDYVVTHSVYGGAWNEGVPQVGIDVFRFEDGLIVEHWDNLGDVVDDMDSTSQTNGVLTPATDLDSTEANQALLEEMAQVLFVDGDWTNVRNYFDIDNYVQHSVGAGTDGSFLAQLEGQTGVPFYESVKFVHTLGNFGLVMSQGPDIFQQDPDGNYAYYDLFRIENGKIVEHWDVIQLIPPQDQWVNNSGKWGFGSPPSSSLITTGTVEVITEEAVRYHVFNFDSAPYTVTVVESENNTIIVDLGPAPPFAAELRAYVDVIAKPGSVIITHNHGDHFGGAGNFTDYIFYAERTVAEQLNNTTDFTDLNPNPVTPVSGSDTIGDLAMTFDKVSNAETGENGYIFNTEHKILFAGDLVYNVTHPYLREYTPNEGQDEIDNWVAGLNVLKDSFSDYNYLFVGHNGVRSDVSAAIDENIDYLQNAQGIIKGTQMLSSGVTATTHQEVISELQLLFPDYLEGGLFLSLPEAFFPGDPGADWFSVSVLTNEEKALALIAAFESGDQTALDYVSGDTYINHNLTVPSGKDILFNFITGSPSGITTETVRSFETGNYVVTHSIYGGVWNQGVPQVGIDVFRFEDGLIVEHWDNLGDVVDDMDSTSQTNGVLTPATDLDSTDVNQALLEDMAQVLFVNGDWTNVRTYFDIDNYVQHSVGAGTDGSFLAQLEGQTGVPFYESVKFVHTLGNFGLVMSQGPDIFQQDPEGTYAYYDLFRIENGKIVEHWDMIQLIPPQDQWANNNGKWGDETVATTNMLAQTSDVTLAPNPFSGTTNFIIQLEEGGIFQFQVFDITGKEVSRRPVEFNEGVNNFFFSGNQLSNGLYSYKFSNGQGFISGKMMLVR